MSKFLLVLLPIFGMATATYAQQQDMNSKQSNHKILVAYFSATGQRLAPLKRWRMLQAGNSMRLPPSNPIRVPTSTGTTSNRVARWR